MLLILRKQLHLLQLMQLTTSKYILFAVKDPKCKTAILSVKKLCLKHLNSIYLIYLIIHSNETQN